MKQRNSLFLSLLSKKPEYMLASFFILGSIVPGFANNLVPVGATDVYNRAVSLFEKRKWDPARELFHQYLAEYSETPLYITCLYYLAFCYQQMENKEQAAILYHKIIDAKPEGEDAFWAQMSLKRLADMGF